MKMFDLTIGTLEYGWADVEITINSQILQYVFEYTPNDTLADLVQSALKLVFGNNSEVVFWNHPNNRTLFVETISNSLCKITTEEYSQELTVKQYAKTVFRMFDKYIYAHSVQEYENGWKRPFPSTDLEKLKGNYKLWQK
jgi:hypothetical protein